jgi:hypothetical protein
MILVAASCSLATQNNPASPDTAISARLLTGNGPPTAADGGSTGDLYLDTSGAALWVLESSGWTNVVTLQGPAGATGPAGAAGQTGATGPAGSAGADGHTWFTGSTVPAAGLGANGDLYLNTATAAVYTKAGGAWGLVVSLQGPTGSNGTNGNSWLSGSGMPGSGLGNNGDLYLDSLDAIVYSKTSGSWHSLFSFPLAAAQLVYTAFSGSFSQNSLGYGDGVFVIALGAGVRTSTDGRTWSNQVSAGSNTLNAVAFANHTFVAVGNAGSIEYSSDGAQTWNAATNPAGSELRLNAVIYGKGMFVAAGQNGLMLTSPDGIAWTQQTSGVSLNLEALAFGNSSFVAVGDNGGSGDPALLTSANGTSWTAQDSSSFTNGNLMGVAFGNGGFVLVGAGSVLGSSVDGVSWTSQTLFASGFSTVAFSSVGNGSFVALGSKSVLTSSYGSSWSTQYWDNLGLSTSFRCVVAGGGIFLVVAQSIPS